MITNFSWRDRCMIKACPTQGVLDSKISHFIKKTSQIFLKVGSNYVPISEFATRHLNLRKPQKPKKMDANCNQRSSFTALIFGILDSFYRKCFWYKIGQSKKAQWRNGDIAMVANSDSWIYTIWLNTWQFC